MKEIEFEQIITTGERAYGIWESGKMVAFDSRDRGKMWDIKYLENIPTTKEALRKLYPNTSVLALGDKKIASVRKMYIDAVNEMETKLNKEL